MEEAVSSFLAGYPELEYKDGRGIVRCLLSGHEMPCRLEVLQSYVRGKKFLKLKANVDFDFHSLQPFIVPSLHRKHQLFCALTNRYLNKRPEQVKAHLSGRKYIRALERYKSGQQQLFAEKGKKGKALSDGPLQLEAQEREGLEERAGEVWVDSVEEEEGSNTEGGEMEVDASEIAGVVDTVAGTAGMVDTVADTEVVEHPTAKPGAVALTTRKRKRKEHEIRGRQVKRKGHTRIPRNGVKSKLTATKL